MEKRNTVQRELVLNAVQSLASHPTADEVYAKIKAEHPSVGRATVYRNLAALSDAGFLLRVPLANAADRFDHRADGHYHIICEKCGAFCDVPLLYNKQFDKDAENSTGYTNIKHDMLITGLCPQCKADNV